MGGSEIGRGEGDKTWPTQEKDTWAALTGSLELAALHTHNLKSESETDRQTQRETHM